MQDVPIELWRLVAFQLRAQDTSNLSRTCKLIHRSVRPLLYEFITVDFCKPGQFHKIPLLLVSLLNQPVIGQHVRRLVIREHRRPQSVWTDQNKMDSLPTRVLIELADRGRKITQDQSECWLKELSIGNVEAFTILLLSYCPYIQHLKLDNDFQKTWAWNKSDIAPNYGTLWQAILGLQSLQSIDIDRPGHKPVAWSSNRVAALLRLPQISSIKMSVLEDEIQPSEPLNGIKAPNLKIFELWNSLVSEDTVHRLISTAPSLISLHIDFKRHTAITREPFSRYVDEWIDASKLSDVLRRPATLSNTSEANSIQSVADHTLSSLEYLGISTCWRQTENSWDVSYEGGLAGARDWNCQHGVKGIIGSLKHLNNLKRLEISLEMLLGWDDETATPLHELLPVSLTHLCLRAEFGCWEYSPWTRQCENWSIIKLFLDYQENRLSDNLKHVKVFIPSCIILPYVEDNLPALENAIRGAGAEFETVQLEKDYGSGMKDYSYSLDLFDC